MTVTIRGGTVVDGTGAPPVRADVVIEGTRVAGIGSGCGRRRRGHRDRRHGHVGRPGLRRPAHALRRAAFLGSEREPVAAARRHDRARRQLRLFPGAHGAGARRLHLAHDGAGRRDAAGRAACRRAVGLELLRRLAGTPRRSHRGECGLPRRPLDVAPARHGRACRRRGRHGGRHRRHGGGAARGAGGGSARLLDLAGAHPQRRRRRSPSRRGRPPARRWSASRPRCASTRERPMELIVAGCLNGFSAEDIDFLATMSLLADRPVNWNVLGVSAMNAEGAWSQLAAGSAASARGATVLALTLPHTMQLRLSFEHGAILDGLPGWREIFALPPPERMECAVGPGDPPSARRRSAVGRGGHSAAPRGVGPPDHRRDLRPRECRHGGQERGGGGAPAAAWRPSMHCSTSSWPMTCARASGRPSPRARRTGSCGRRSGRTHGRSSAVPTPGAHLDTMCGAIYSTSMLGDGVRARGLLSWEQAVRLLTDVPARLYGLRDRGRLEVGGFADVVVFDPATIGHGAVRTRDDLPGGASRLYADALGVRHVLVNGTEIVARGGVHRRRPRTRVALGP